MRKHLVLDVYRREYLLYKLWDEEKHGQSENGRVEDERQGGPDPFGDMAAFYAGLAYKARQRFAVKGEHIGEENVEDDVREEPRERYERQKCDAPEYKPFI